MPSFLATSGTEAPAASSASAWRSLRTICSGVCLFFIESPPCAHLRRSDSHSNWISFRGAGQHEEAHFEVAVANERDGEQLEADDPERYVECQIDVRDEERQGVQDAPYERREARDRTSYVRAPAPGERPIVRKPLRKAHADPCSHRSRKTHQKRHLRVPRRKRCRKQRRQRRDGSIHQANKRWLNNPQHEVLAVPRGPHLPAPKPHSL